MRPYILLVEDSKSAGLATAKFLKQLGCLVEWVKDSVQAVQCVEKKQYDLIFMDLALAQSDGMKTAETIKKLAGETDIPIVALTAYTDDSLKEKCFNLGMVGFIKKPLTTEKATYFLKRYVNK